MNRERAGPEEQMAPWLYSRDNKNRECPGYTTEEQEQRVPWLYNRDNKNRECPGYTTVKTEQTKLDEWTVASLYSSAI